MTSVYLLDTNVLIPFYSKDFLLELGSRGLPVRWSHSIEAEFRRVWARLDLGGPADASLILKAARTAIPEWRALELPSIAEAFSLPDPNDRHVLAAAVGCGATVIVTRNLKDFPPAVVSRYGIEVKTPDQVICDLYDSRPGFVVAAAAAMRTRLRRPPMTVDEWLAGLVRGKLGGAATRLVHHRHEI